MSIPLLIKNHSTKRYNTKHIWQMLFIVFIVVVPLTLYKIMMMSYKLISKQDDTVQCPFQF